jgi:hypothetical protein
MSRARRLALTGLALASSVVLIAVVSPRVGGIEGTGTPVAAQVGTEVAKEALPLRCEATATLDDHDADEQVETLAALKRCREERERAVQRTGGGVLAEVYERVDAREGARR